MKSSYAVKPNPELAIQVQGLAKSYGKVRALRGIDLAVKRGEIFGFLGPNGAASAACWTASDRMVVRRFSWGWTPRLIPSPFRPAPATCPVKCSSTTT